MSVNPIFKNIDANNFSIDERVVHKTQEITSASLGVFSFQFRSGSLSGSSIPRLPDKSGSHWESLRTLFYASSSAVRDNSSEERVFRMADGVVVDLNPINKQFLTKFFDSGSVFSIPQKYFGERIKPSSFKLIDDYGIDGDFVESQAFAYLAIRSYLNLPISFPETTGVREPCLGGIITKNF